MFYVCCLPAVMHLGQEMPETQTMSSVRVPGVPNSQAVTELTTSPLWAFALWAISSSGAEHCSQDSCRVFSGVPGAKDLSVEAQGDHWVGHWGLLSPPDQPLGCALTLVSSDDVRPWVLPPCPFFPDRNGKSSSTISFKATGEINDGCFCSALPNAWPRVRGSYTQGTFIGYILLLPTV